MIDLLLRLQSEHQLTYLFISHDLRVVRALADEIMVMQLGKVVEHRPAGKLLAQPEHSYTRALIGAALDLKVTDETVYISSARYSVLGACRSPVADNFMKLPQPVGRSAPPGRAGESPPI